MINEYDIQNNAENRTAYAEGQLLFKGGLVVFLEYYRQYDTFVAKVRERMVSTVKLKVDPKGKIQDYHCDCNDFYIDDGACRHTVAALLMLKSRWSHYFGGGKQMGDTLTKGTENMLGFFQQVQLGQGLGPDSNPGFPSLSNAALPNTRVPVKLNPILHIYYDIRYKTAKRYLEFTIGSESKKPYVLKSLRTFIDALRNGNEVIYGKNFTLNPQTAIFEPHIDKLIHLITSTIEDERYIANMRYYNAQAISVCSDDRNFQLTNTTTAKFLDIMTTDGEHPFEMDLSYSPKCTSTVVLGRPPLTFTVAKHKSGLNMTLTDDGNHFFALDTNYTYVCHGNTIYKVDPVFSQYITPVMTCFRENNSNTLYIPNRAAQHFITSVVPEMQKISNVALDPNINESFFQEPLIKQVYLDRLGDGISAKVLFKYGLISINPASRETQSETQKNGKALLRALPEEQRLLYFMGQFGFTAGSAATEGLFVLADEAAAYTFIQAGLEALNDQAEVFYSHDFKPMATTSKGKLSCGVRVNTGKGLLEMDISYDQFSASEMMDLLASYKTKRHYHRLKNGQFIDLDSSSLGMAAELIDQLNLTQRDLEMGTVALPMYRAMYIDSLVREGEGFHLERSSGFKRLVQDVSEPQDMEFPVPSRIQGTLRDYQKVGFKWLKTLAHYGFGGILADDMGLGKTLQVITLIESLADGAGAAGAAGTDKKPSLVVAPTSLVYNWQDEVLKFAPHLVVAVICGAQGDRRERFSEIATADIVVTTYGMMKRDMDYYKDIEFQYCFIDEAQHIKNPNTLNAKSVKQIKAQCYFALTGTPVENTLTELWSIFDFIMPGYLMTHGKFLKKFETPISKNGDAGVAKELARHIKPFVMRRMKRDVLTELPEKIESKMTNEMTPEQAKLYQAFAMQARKEFQAEIAANGFEKSKIKILAILTRLRQICCHPSLFIDDYKGDSGKLDMLMELLEDAIDGGHRVLVFSQFTAMLSIIKTALTSAKISYHYLDGATSAQERIQLVNSFNGGEKEVFLISLKAGGTGLNLTGADMVIHYDPWWNPAVEDQATDRAYRMGQKNVVQVFKLITKGTLEERIYELQQRKKELIDTVIAPGENFLTKMSESEIKQLFDIHE